MLSLNEFEQLETKYHDIITKEMHTMINKTFNDVFNEPLVKETTIIDDREVCTQKCLSLTDVERMAMELMNTNFIVFGKTYNLCRLGYTFYFTDFTTILGQCNHSLKTINLSSWIIEHSFQTMGDWKLTMLHEIAHGIDAEIRGHSGHDKPWVDVAHAIGSDGIESVPFMQFKSTLDTAYYLKCNSCGNNSPQEDYIGIYRMSFAKCSYCKDKLHLIANPNSKFNYTKPNNTIVYYL
jgi:predicted SprT family Zn-dependent metalloprotease